MSELFLQKETKHWFGFYGVTLNFMEGFIQFVKLLFLSKTFLLTPTPIDLDNEWVELTLAKPLTALTVGAAVRLKLRKTEELFGDSESFEADREIAEKLIPKGIVQAEMTDTQGNVLVFSNRYILLADEYVIYILNRDTPFPPGLAYTKLRIRSAKPIQGVEISWKNFRL